MCVTEPMWGWVLEDITRSITEPMCGMVQNNVIDDVTESMWGRVRDDVTSPREAEYKMMLSSPYEAKYRMILPSPYEAGYEIIYRAHVCSGRLLMWYSPKSGWISPNIRWYVPEEWLYYFFLYKTCMHFTTVYVPRWLAFDTQVEVVYPYLLCYVLGLQVYYKLYLLNTLFILMPSFGRCVHTHRCR